MKCSFCNRDEETVSYLVQGPPGMNICDECALTIADGMINRAKDSDKTVICTFCRKSDKHPHGMGRDGNSTICSNCTTIALRSLEKFDAKYGKSAKDIESHFPVYG